MISNFKKFILDTYPYSIYKPDNYLSFSNPDYLLIEGNQLFGIFIPTPKERENVNLLLYRAYASRLVYSPNMKVVLINADTMDNIYNKLIEEVFHKIIDSYDNEESFKKCMKDRIANNKENIIEKKVRSKQSKFFKNVTLLNERINDEYKGRFNIRENMRTLSITPWGNKDRNKKLPLRGTLEKIFILKKFKHISVTKLTTIFFYRYKLDNGKLLVNKGGDSLFMAEQQIFKSTSYERDFIRLAMLGVYLKQNTHE